MLAHVAMQRSGLLFEHDLFGKPVPTFPDHARLRFDGREEPGPAPQFGRALTACDACILTHSEAAAIARWRDRYCLASAAFSTFGPAGRHFAHPSPRFRL